MEFSSYVKGVAPGLSQLNLTDGQRAKFLGISAQGIECFLHHWFQLSKNPVEGRIWKFPKIQLYNVKFQVDKLLHVMTRLLSLPTEQRFYCSDWNVSTGVSVGIFCGFNDAGAFCDAAWDEIYCWPPTRSGENVSRSCSEVMKHDPEVLRPESILG